MHIALFPGTFDPVTLGHMDIIERSARLFDQLVVGIADNPAKHTMFTLYERIAMLQQAVAHLPHVSVQGFTGMLPDFVRSIKADVLVRGVRSMADCDYEIQLTGMYHMVLPELEIIMLPPSGNLSCVSSTLVRDIIRHGGDVSPFVPSAVALKVQERYNAQAEAKVKAEAEAKATCSQDK